MCVKGLVSHHEIWKRLGGSASYKLEPFRFRSFVQIAYFIVAIFRCAERLPHHALINEASFDLKTCDSRPFLPFGSDSGMIWINHGVCYPSHVVPVPVTGGRGFINAR